MLYAVQAIAAAASNWHQPKCQTRARESSAEQRSDAAADSEAGEKDRHDDGQRVDRGAEQQAEHARPDRFCAQRAESRERDGNVDGRRRAPALTDGAGTRQRFRD